MLSVVIPVFNEEKNIPLLITQLRDSLKSTGPYEILLIDDNSTDNSKEVMDLYAKKFANVRAVHKTWNKGVGYAIREGISRARGDPIITMDADLSHNPEEIKKLVRRLRHADVVLGSRFVEGGKLNSNFSRRLLSGSFNLISRMLLGLDVKDLTTGFRAHKRKVIDSIELESTDFNIHVEIPIKAHEKGFIIAEVPIVYNKRHSGSSKLNYFKVGPKYIGSVYRSLVRSF